MKLYASHHDSFHNCGTYVYVGTKEEVEAEWNKRDQTRKELVERGFRGYTLTPFHEVSGNAREFGKDFSGLGFLMSMDKFTYNYYLTLH